MVDVYATEPPAGADRAFSKKMWHLSYRMTRITIVGAGQAGLQLGYSLRRKGYQVTLVTDRSASDIRNGRVMSTQCLFPSSLEIEKEAGLDDFASQCPEIRGLAVHVATPKGGQQQPIVQWETAFKRPAKSIDQRLKFARWMQRFESIGGTLIIQKVDLKGLERLRDSCDLLIVAAGKGEIAGLFQVDKTRSPYATPQRALALVCVTGLEPRKLPAVSFNIAPGVGEYFVMPCLVNGKLAYNMLIEGVVGGPFDAFRGLGSAQEQLARVKQLLADFFPWEAARCARAVVTDANAWLSGRFPPTVRHPVAQLPSGRNVLGIGDVFALNDPLTGQGANNACKSAHVYLQEILGRAGDFDRNWMSRTAERAFGEVLQHSTAWTNLMLHPPEHVVECLGAAQRRPGLARAFAAGFDNPSSLSPWLFDADACRIRILNEPEVPPVPPVPPSSPTVSSPTTRPQA